MSYMTTSIALNDSPATTSITLNDSTATITFSNAHPMTWTLSLQQGTDTVSKKGVISQKNSLSYLPARILPHGEIKRPPANPAAEW